MFNSVPIDVLSTPNKPARLESQLSIVDRQHTNNTSSNGSSNGKEGGHHSNNGQKIDGQRFEILERADTQQRIKILLKYLRKFGVPEKYLFDLDDLIEMKNMPKVTRCIAMLAKMVRDLHQPRLLAF